MRNKFTSSFAGAAFIIAASGSAFAADLNKPVYKAPPPPPPIPVFSWTGFYVGVNAGWGWNNTSGNNYCLDPNGVVQGDGCSILPQGILKPSGALGGGQIGYNLQYGQFVYGLEADIQAADISDSTTITAPGGFPQVGGGSSEPGSTFSQSQKLDWFGTFRARVGWTPWDRTLLYATGGLIYGQEKVSQLYVSPNVYPASDSSVRDGWTAGGGVEYALWSNLTARIEGLYYDMGDQTITSGVNPNTDYTRNSTFNFKGGIVRAGLNYKFN